jgi:hypothetical protein
MAPVYMAFLRFMGDENEARNYSYSLEVGANGRKMVWEGTPRSVWDSHRKVRDSNNGLLIQRNMALFFSGGDRKELKLMITGRIWKKQQTPDGACVPILTIFKKRIQYHLTGYWPSCRHTLLFLYGLRRRFTVLSLLSKIRRVG